MYAGYFYSLGDLRMCVYICIYIYVYVCAHGVYFYIGLLLILSLVFLVFIIITIATVMVTIPISYFYHVCSGHLTEIYISLPSLSTFFSNSPVPTGRDRDY